jgi:chorismate mutase
VLLELVLARLRLSDQVAAAKFGTGAPIDDPARERQELAAIRRQATSTGLDERAVVGFFTDQITASKMVQRSLFRRWTDHPDQAPTDRPDLGALRAELDRLTTGLLDQLGRQRDDGVAVPAGLDPLHRDALRIALRSVRTR